MEVDDDDDEFRWRWRMTVMGMGLKGGCRRRVLMEGRRR